MTQQAEALLDRIAVLVRSNLPPGITPAYLDGFLSRHRSNLVGVLDRHLSQRRGRRPVVVDAPVDEWTPARRSSANLAAMQSAATVRPEDMTAAQRRVLSRYSGWGGLSIERLRDQFPPDFPAPDPRGLIHEYYTPTKVANEIARVVRPLLPGLTGPDGSVLSLEPSAGIGRFVRAFSGPGFESVHWLTVEWSELSARMLQAIVPDLALTNAPFERWIREHSDESKGRINLVVANPPYGQRGAAVTEDPDRSYREKVAYAYFLRRGLDLLAPGGLGVYLIPAGFVSGGGAKNRALREKVLRRHHLSAAYRLPSNLFPGAFLVTDLIFFRARGGTLREIAPADSFIVEGRYFKENPSHILGREDGSQRARHGYQIIGEFTRLPELVERPICADCSIQADSAPAAHRTRTSGTRRVTRAERALAPHLSAAVALGMRVDTFLAALAREDDPQPSQLWPELHAALTAWVEANGNPRADTDLARLIREGVTGAERFLSAFTRGGTLIAGLRQRPVHRPRYLGRPDDIAAQAELLYRTQRALNLVQLLTFHQDQGGTLRSTADAQEAMVEAGWALDGEEWDQLLPMEDYLSGHLWPRHDRAQARARHGDGTATNQARRLVETIAPAVFDDIDGVSPRQGWIPLDLVAGWLTETLNSNYGTVSLTRESGLVVVEGTDYEDIGDAYLSAESRWFIGWVNHDRTVFRPKKRRHESLDEIRLAKAREWEHSFRAWIGSDDERRSRVEEAYNRRFKGYVAPTYAAEPLTIARWNNDTIRLHPHQVAGARRLLANRGGLLAFDVGVGKTYTGIAVMARARQEGWCRRPVILVPNSIIWKWAADIERVLPDYRVAVIGSKKKRLSRGPRKGLVTSVTDSPQERANKWTRFQAGEYDVVLLTYSALSRTRMNESAVREYANHTEAIRREIKLRQRNAGKAKTLTERQRAILREGVSAWVAEMMELPGSWQYDPGIAWDDIGVDILIVDEAQNFKNLYLPEAREGGVPRFMGNAGTGSKRAWQLDFRAAAVRRRTGGAGIVLLSATPAKNSPLEFYNLIQYVDHDAWSRMGIRDPEQFIDRYLRIELKPVVDSKMDVVERSAVTGFQNLHELRDVIFRYGEFKTAEDVGLRLPEPTVNVVEVDMNDDQATKYAEYVARIEAALESTSVSEKGQILGLLARLALVAIHAELDAGLDWKTAATADVSPHSPKFDALTQRVLANPTCGHIIFVDNVAAHRWMMDVLIEAGIPEERIAVLNAITAKGAADRQRIAHKFNGDPDEGTEPEYDVVIANAIAYEGIDLQTRTCAIHHLDLPWEPATLQQRNGRGVRQGNTLTAIEINYYFARRSQDGLRFNLIQGKLGWMKQLLRSQDRDTNNPGAQMALGPEEILLLVSRDPEKTVARLASVRERRQEDARRKVAADAARLLRSANARFRKAERTSDPAESSRLRLEAEGRLEDLAAIDTEAWPWAPWMYAVRERSMLVPVDGQAPVHEGLRIGVPSQWNPDNIDYAEFGRVKGDQIGLREAGAARWVVKTTDEVAALNLEPGHLAPDWPDEEQLTDEIRRYVQRHLSYAGSWPSLGWSWASDAWMERTWGRFGPEIVESLADARSWATRTQQVPAIIDGALRITQGSTLRSAFVLPPTVAGWRQFLELAPTSGLKFTDLKSAGTYWWDRTIPQTLLSAARSAKAAK